MPFFRIRLLVLIGSLLASFASFAQNPPITLRNQRELFVDDYLIDTLINLDWRLGTPVSAGKALPFDAPWEGRFCTYVSVVNAGDRFQMYYRGLAGHDEKGEQQVTCYAESKDGIHWTKPKLRLFKVNGTLDNNVVLGDNSLRTTHNLTVLYDNRPGIPAEERYKAVGGESLTKVASSGLFRYVSADGIHWKRYPKDTTALFHDYALDSQNVPTWVPSEQHYAIYFRAWTGGKPGELYPAGGIRSIARSTSRDFIHWSKPELMTFGDTEREHLYTNTTHPYFRAPQLLISMPFRFSPQLKVLSDAQLIENGTDKTQWKGVADGVFMTSRGGTRYDRKFMESFVRPGSDPKNWGARSNIPAMGVIATGPAEMSFFVTRAYGTKAVFLERMTLRTDGFTSLHGGYKEGSIVTKPVFLQGNNLSANYATSSVGYVKVAILDENGQVVPGFEESEPLVGDTIDGPITWKNGKTVKELGDRKVRLKFVVRDADLYSFAIQ
ncbi:hypothetical protein [Larkinella rosea]|uniref:Glycosyl hydrolase family 32 N-terminal domain-containing protein n=1 Tax=Larkinella rosea TaxID=2025312 RepID=A0A3P1BUD6_9BACT|nr:hypothetical protein [Larkinella rosea]RRB04720.1 hypothetical protein EHT25_14720 [Larkinella rosea]